ncbi:hypothetical protein [Helicobacter ailurogastricus]|uniref:hypothetical protein n=1 Tax=Helicobacter ailurogastricus TaxID=1578720 RepID=UPI000CF0A993|nr:hypothetical protein [Helicobacter ailurogastricus]
MANKNNDSAATSLTGAAAGAAGVVGAAYAIGAAMGYGIYKKLVTQTGGNNLVNGYRELENPNIFSDT